MVELIVEKTDWSPLNVKRLSLSMLFPLMRLSVAGVGLYETESQAKVRKAGGIQNYKKKLREMEYQQAEQSEIESRMVEIIGIQIKTLLKVYTCRCLYATICIYMILAGISEIYKCIPCSCINL